MKLFFITLIISINIIAIADAGKVSSSSLYNNNNNLCQNVNRNVLSTNITFPQRDQYQQQLLKKAPTAATMAKSNGAPRPHIVMALFDDLGANDLGIFSGGIQTPKTPFMDSLMREGIRLKQFYVQPICSPTRSALMTGRYPMRNGGQHGVGMASDATWIPEDEVTLCERLSKLGYTCKGSGKWHLGHGHFKYTPTGRGFKDFFGPYHGGADHWEHIAWLGGGPHRDAIRRSQHVGEDSNGNGAMYYQGRAKTTTLDHKHGRYERDGRYIHEHITQDNMTHSSDAFTREAVRMIWNHDETKGDGQLFLYLPFTAPHWPTQFYQQDADINSHIPSKKRREFAGMITHLDRCIQQIVETLKRKNMWSNTLFIAYGDNGGDITTGASNWPYRGTKTTPWEGGTRAASFVHSPNPAVVPIERRGTESYALAHVTDWYPTLLSLAGVRSEDLAVPGKPLDGVNMWEGLVNGKYDPGNGQRIEMLYELDDVVHPMGEAKFLTRATNAFVNVTTLRIGDWKLIDGYPGRGDWYGEDPSKAWPVDYIMGPDVTDYNAIPLSLGGKVGDGGQRDFLENGDTSKFKRRWLFNLAKDPTEQHDLQFEHPEMVEKLLKRINQLKSEQVEPIQVGAMNYFKGRGAAPPDFNFAMGRSSGRVEPIADVWDKNGMPANTKYLLDGEEADIYSPTEMRQRRQSKL